MLPILAWELLVKIVINLLSLFAFMFVLSIHINCVCF